MQINYPQTRDDKIYIRQTSRLETSSLERIKNNARKIKKSPREENKQYHPTQVAMTKKPTTGIYRNKGNARQPCMRNTRWYNMRTNRWPCNRRGRKLYGYHGYPNNLALEINAEPVAIGSIPPSSASRPDSCSILLAALRFARMPLR